MDVYYYTCVHVGTRISLYRTKSIVQTLFSYVAAVSAELHQCGQQRAALPLIFKHDMWHQSFSRRRNKPCKQNQSFTVWFVIIYTRISTEWMEMVLYFYTCSHSLLLFNLLTLMHFGTAATAYSVPVLNLYIGLVFGDIGNIQLHPSEVVLQKVSHRNFILSLCNQ